MLWRQNLPVQKHFNQIRKRRIALTQRLAVCIKAFYHHEHEILDILVGQLLGGLARIIALTERVPNEIQIQRGLHDEDIALADGAFISTRILLLALVGVFLGGGAFGNSGESMRDTYRLHL